VQIILATGISYWQSHWFNSAGMFQISLLYKKNSTTSCLWHDDDDDDDNNNNNNNNLF